MMNRTQARGAIARRESFVASSLSGGTRRTAELGQLPSPYREEYKAAERAGTIAYVVRSYQTPIAWQLTTGEIVFPDARYSQTTSCHQTLTREALR